jgi:3-deoxy-D-manno-octulosonate 8-phosphate phosphatase KdsC-like HAD superfamily phosphatase
MGRLGDYGTLAALGLVMYLGSTPHAQTAQTWSGVLSENKCGASHQAMASSLNMTERECAFHCLKGLAKFVVVDDQKNVIPIANQDFAGIPLRLARPVRVTGVLTDKGIVVSRIELPLVHAHIGHVMTAWRETPGQVGLLTIAQSDIRIAAAHTLLLAKSTTLDDMKLHAGHVLQALDATLEKVGPASGYGAKKAAEGAMQHVGFTAAVDNASATVKGHASAVNATLAHAIAATDRAISAAQRIRSAASAADAAMAARDLQPIVDDIGRALQQSEDEMRLMMKAEGL